MVTAVQDTRHATSGLETLSYTCDTKPFQTGGILYPIQLINFRTPFHGGCNELSYV